MKGTKKYGNKIFIITARNESGMPPEYEGKMQELTKKWLLDNNIKYKKLKNIKYLNNYKLINN